MSVSRPTLSVRQARTLEVLRTFPVPPTRAELGAALGVSAQTADFHLRALAAKGYVQISSKSRGLTLIADEGLAEDSAPAGIHAGRVQAGRVIPVVGRVAAGQPGPSLENLEGSVPLPEGSAADFALRVIGDSMIEAGILDGDLVLVEQSKEAQSGDIVVALVGEGEMQEATVKRFLPGKKRVVLRPANAAMEDIVILAGEPFALAGRVVGVLRLWD